MIENTRNGFSQKNYSNGQEISIFPSENKTIIVCYGILTEIVQDRK